jgi:hypothetical protein
MRKCLSELSLRGRRVLFLLKLALSPRQCGKHRHNSLIVRAYQLDMRVVKSSRWEPFHCAIENFTSLSAVRPALSLICRIRR